MKSPRSVGMLAVASLAIAACGGDEADDSAESTTPDETTTQAAGDDADAESGDELSGAVISYNSPENWANWGGVLEAFSEKTGLEAPSDPKNSGQTVAALEAEAASPAADTAYYGIVFGIEAAANELVEPYEAPNYDEIPDALKADDGSWFAVHQGTVAFLVNTDELGDAPVPECWDDLTGDEYDGKVGFLDPTQAAIGYSVVTAANLALGGSLDDWGPGMEWATSMTDNGLQLPAQTATAMVQQGEIPILIDADFNGYKLANDEDAPIEVVLPCEGTLSIPYVMSLVKDGPNPDNGKALIDFVLSDEGQAMFAESYLRPIRSVDVPAEVADSMLPDEEYEEKVIAPDFAAMRDAQDTFTEQWTAEVAG